MSVLCRSPEHGLYAMAALKYLLLLAVLTLTCVDVSEATRIIPGIFCGIIDLLDYIFRKSALAYAIDT